MNEWDVDANFPDTPETVSFENNKKTQWEFNKCGHVWKASCITRAKGLGCDLCGRKIAVEKRRKKSSLIKIPFRINAQRC